MTPLLIIFAPFVRLLFHSLAASFGFSCIALIAILPVQVIRLVSIYTIFSQQQISVFESVESWILYIDAMLLVFVIVIYSVYFIFEQGRALWTLIKSETQVGQAALKSQTDQAQAGGATPS
jgi:hypothetical protein